MPRSSPVRAKFVSSCIPRRSQEDGWTCSLRSMIPVVVFRRSTWNVYSPERRMSDREGYGLGWCRIARQLVRGRRTRGDERNRQGQLLQLPSDRTNRRRSRGDVIGAALVLLNRSALVCVGIEMPTTIPAARTPARSACNRGLRCDRREWHRSLAPCIGERLRRCAGRSSMPGMSG